MKKPAVKTASLTPPEVHGPGRRERRRRETREKLFRAAMKLFAEQGFLETTTQQISESADVGEGTFFNYFPTKGHVFTVLTDIQLDKVTQAQSAARDESRPTREVLRRLMHSIAQEPGRSPALTRSLFTAFLSNDVVREIVGLTLERGRKGLAHIISRGQRRGEIRRDRRAADLAMTFQKALSGSLLLWSMRPKGRLKSSLDQTFIDFWESAREVSAR